MDARGESRRRSHVKRWARIVGRIASRADQFEEGDLQTMLMAIGSSLSLAKQRSKTSRHWAISLYSLSLLTREIPHGRGCILPANSRDNPLKGRFTLKQSSRKLCTPPVIVLKISGQNSRFYEASRSDKWKFRFLSRLNADPTHGYLAYYLAYSYPS